ncbi:hypothetical protein PIECOFPK_01202 [Mycovorax composti]|jgi:Glycerophosphoryl diester phosphodiesterase|uniref:GP-PDE domain-containing protein n=2 Tax=Chitinophagaceae TaxID=563835 RepID=A0ABZ2EJ48_9BACT
MRKYIWIVCCSLLWSLSGASQTLNTFNIKNTKELREFFTYSKDRIPMICGHRSGAQSLYPENTIAGMEYVLQHMPAFFEIDPRLTKDSVIVVFHDATLERTTNGKGKLIDYTWKEVQQLRLKDSKGNLTDYRIHTLDEVLQWAKGKTILMLDKKDVPFSMIYDAIKRNKAEHNVLISAYEPEEAAYYYSRDPNLMFEVFVSNEERLRAYEATGVPTSNMVAYFGQPKKKAFYDLVHSKGMMVIIFTAKIMEKEEDEAIRVQSYKKVVQQGGDILLSDRALEAYESIREFIPAKSSKYKFLRQIKKR